MSIGKATQAAQRSPCRWALLGVAIFGLLSSVSVRAMTACQLAGLAECKDTTSANVHVADYDTGVPGVLFEDELQCAIDCLDGNPDSDAEVDWQNARRSQPCREGLIPLEDCLPYEFPIRQAGAPADDPACVDGGTVIFDPGLTYVVGRPLRLPACVLGQLIVRGNGATLYVVPNRVPFADSPEGRFAVFERVAPSRNVCSTFVGNGGLAARHWVIEDLQFALGEAGGPGMAAFGETLLVKGMELHAPYWPTVRSCTFAAMSDGQADVLEDRLRQLLQPYLPPGSASYVTVAGRPFDIGIEMRRGTWALIEGCSFERSRFHDVILSDQGDCLDGEFEGDELGDCWYVGRAATEESGPDPRGCIVDAVAWANGSLHVTLRQSAHQVRGATPSQLQGTLPVPTLEQVLLDGPTPVVTSNGDSLVAENVELRGGRPLHYWFRHQWAGYNATWRDVRMVLPDHVQREASWDHPLVWNDASSGLFTLDGLTLAGFGDDLFYRDELGGVNSGGGQPEAAAVVHGLFRNVTGLDAGLAYETVTSWLAFVEAEGDAPVAHRSRFRRPLGNAQFRPPTNVRSASTFGLANIRRWATDDESGILMSGNAEPSRWLRWCCGTLTDEEPSPVSRDLQASGCELEDWSDESCGD